MCTKHIVRIRCDNLQPIVILVLAKSKTERNHEKRKDLHSSSLLGCANCRNKRSVQIRTRINSWIHIFSPRNKPARSGNKIQEYKNHIVKFKRKHFNPNCHLHFLQKKKYTNFVLHFRINLIKHTVYREYRAK